MKRYLVFALAAAGAFATACVNEDYDLNKPYDGDYSIIPHLVVPINNPIEKTVSVSTLLGTSDYEVLPDGTVSITGEMPAKDYTVSASALQTGANLGTMTLTTKVPPTYVDAVMLYNSATVDITVVNPTGNSVKVTGLLRAFTESEYTKSFEFILGPEKTPQTKSISINDISSRLPKKFQLENVKLTQVATVKAGTEGDVTFNIGGKLNYPLIFERGGAMTFKYSFNNLGVNLSDYSESAGIKDLIIKGYVKATKPAILNLHIRIDSEQFTGTVDAYLPEYGETTDPNLTIRIESKDGQPITSVNNLDTTFTIYAGNDRTYCPSNLGFTFKLDSIELPAGVTIKNK